MSSRYPPILGLLLLAAAPALKSAIPPGMTLVWSDEFEYTGAPDPAKWVHEIGGGGWGNREVQVYTDLLENSRVEDGRLIIEARQHREGTRTPTYTSARLITRGLGQWQYGRMEARIKLPGETGTWAAFWMLAYDRLYGTALWPDNGEIDIVEHVGYEEDPLFKSLRGDPALPNIHGTLHTYMRNGRDNRGIGGSTFVATASSAFHTYAVNWSEDRIAFEVDGMVYRTVLRSELVPARNPPDDPWQYWPFNQRFFLILNVAVGGEWGGHFNSTYYPDRSPYGTDGIHHDGVWPQRMEVEYVRVYAHTGEWKGLAVDAHGNADAGAWLGRINVSHAPWIYVYSLGKHIHMPVAAEEVFHTDSQWVFIPRP